ncbi:hypothetical protein Tco_0629048 [Tanacetum coccineum]|uniref:Uncharacterized protein n=1 Tax=Tanacetum coccineum TaxID=301880 RepID=A0ABQ4WS27_9ASTR
MEYYTTHVNSHVESTLSGPDDAPTKHQQPNAAGRGIGPCSTKTALTAKLDSLWDACYTSSHYQPAVFFLSEEVEEQKKSEVPQRPNLSAGVLPHTAVTEPAGPSVAADKGKAPMPDLDIPAEFLAEDAQARKRFEEEQASERLAQRLRAEDLAQEDLPNVSEERAKELDDLMMRMTETDWLNLMMQVGSDPALARELLGADVNEENFIERMNAIKEKKKRALADLRISTAL